MIKSRPFFFEDFLLKIMMVGRFRDMNKKKHSHKENGSKLLKQYSFPVIHTNKYRKFTFCNKVEIFDNFSILHSFHEGVSDYI